MTRMNAVYLAIFLAKLGSAEFSFQGAKRTELKWQNSVEIENEEPKNVLGGSVKM